MSISNDNNCYTKSALWVSEHLGNDSPITVLSAQQKAVTVTQSWQFNHYEIV